MFIYHHITKFTRAEWIAHRDFTPIKPVGDDALLEYARVHFRAGSAPESIFRPLSMLPRTRLSFHAAVIAPPCNRRPLPFNARGGPNVSKPP